MQDFTFEGKSLTQEFASEEMINALIAAQLDRGSQSVHCEASSDGKAALYQWVVQFGDKITIMTDHFICRSGANAWEYPQCPHSACLDNQCQSCEAGFWAQ